MQVYSSMMMQPMEIKPPCNRVSMRRSVREVTVLTSASFSQQIGEALHAGSLSEFWEIGEQSKPISMCGLLFATPRRVAMFCAKVVFP